MSDKIELTELEVARRELAAAKQALDIANVQLSHIDELIAKHEKELRTSFSDSRVGKVEGLLNKYRRKADDAIQGTNKFRHELMVNLQAWGLVLQMVDNAATHKEKNARLRGCIELVNGTITKLQSHHFESVYYFRDWPNIFLADGANKALMQRIHSLEEQLKAATAQGRPEPQPTSGPGPDDLIF